MFTKTIDFSRFTSIKVGPKINLLIIEKNDAIPNDRYLIGHGNNLLVSNNPPPLMMLGDDFDFMKIEDGYLYVGCATSTGRLLSFAKKHDLGGFEFISKLPGSIGGMVAMNAGVKEYEIFNILESVKINEQWIKAEEIEHGYRFAKLEGVATEVRFKIKYGFDKKLLDDLISLRSNQPKKPSAGSLFKNPPNDYAGRLIESVGLKGKQIGGMAWSDVHANFLVNIGGGTFEDSIALIELAKKLVLEQYGIALEEEVKIL
ncbi:MAG: UDP-N-acetylmuramate dehydrogenase [Campylobacterales bacterium]|nr:UDP-N-acetylmuramate dehydrogenase [Campylobacterota bacterium]MBD3843986.1 UDP-N-acetylmuramate dehydrogenase [Campylobacterales bacterium]